MSYLGRTPLSLDLANQWDFSETKVKSENTETCQRRFPLDSWCVGVLLLN